MLTRTTMALAAAVLVTSAIGADAASLNLSDPETAQFYINHYQAQPQQSVARANALNARAEFIRSEAASRSVFADPAKGIVW